MEIETVGRDWWRIKPVYGHDDTCPFGEQHEWDCSQQKPEWKYEHIADWNKREQPTIADYLEANKEMMDKTGCKVVTIASLKKFGGLDD